MLPTKAAVEAPRAPRLRDRGHAAGSVATAAAALALAALAALASAAVARDTGPPAPYRVMLGQPELVLDTRGLVETTSGLTRVQHRPDKMGQVVTQEHPWEAGTYFYSSVVQVSESDVRLYYDCSGPAEPEVNLVCVATSANGVAFTKPLDLGQVAYNGSKANNIVFSTPYGPGGHAGTGWGNSVLFDNHTGVPSSERFKMLFDTDTGEYAGRKLLIAVSADGFAWRQLRMRTTSDGSLVPRANFADTCTALLWVERLGKYVAFGRHDASTPGAVCVGGDSYGNFRQVAAIVEADGTATPTGSFADRQFNVTPTVILHTVPGVDPPCVDFYNPAPIDRSGVTFIFPAATRHLAQPGKPGTNFPSPYSSCRTKNDGLLDVRMAFSRLGGGNLSFERLSSEPVVPRGMGVRSPLTGLYDSAASDWDAGMTFMSTGYALLTSEPSHLSMYYFGGQTTHGFEAYHLGEQYPSAKRGFGRVRWRRDGFVSLSSAFDGSTGVLTSGPLLVHPPPAAGSELHVVVNAATSVSGGVTVELLAADGATPVGRFPKSLPVVGDSVAATVYFNATSTGLAGFTCDNENAPGAMPKPGSVRLVADIADAVRAAGDAGLRLRMSLLDAHLFSVALVEAPAQER